ncbi:DMT family transporter [Microbacterium hydrocarbonoxydans]|uniref:Permease of the drug/metabolite transporter (DMT) superfamily n=1 Tax=Microbacterium hydrocarbonoxydans TaxID=273678 RepID=A0A1H4J1A2_9MICO|nr:DMT family transporter [Microbacterium hydrocarbonoxydans]SEB39736.1 Permease of the drug/metabolite transporter (DMT) superfamily [Microbacterium hydrocarbonoxydans]
MSTRFRWMSLRRQEVALIAVTAVWGSTFLLVHWAMQHSGPWFFVGIRFLVAGIISIVIFRSALRGIRWRDIGAGIAIGVMIYLGYGLQTVGLQTIDSSTSAFITAMYIPLVPLAQWAVFRKRPPAMAFVGAGLAFLGLILIAGPDAFALTLGSGEILTMISTLPIAAEIILISVFAGRIDLGRITIVQLLTAGVLGLLTMPVVGEGVPEFSWIWVGCAVGLGAASCIIQLTMNWAQKSISPTRATIIYAGEPVWAAAIGRIAGERLPVTALIGGALVVLGILASELRLVRRRDEAPAAE